MPIPALLRQHNEDASTKWWQRCGATRQLDTRIEWLIELDEMIDAHLDGLLEAGDAGEQVSNQAYERSLQLNAADLRGDSFTLVALRVLGRGLSALEACAKDTQLHGALGDYLSWSPGEPAKQAIWNWCQDCSHPMHTSAVSYLHMHGLDRGNRLDQALFKSTTDTICTVLDAIANCGRIDLLGRVFQLLDAPQFPEDSPIKFAAARCALLLGSTKRAVASLWPFAVGDTPFALDACQLLSLVVPTEQFNIVLQSSNTAVAIRCVGWHGNPVHVPWLLQQMQNPDLLPWASESLRQIVGISPNDIAEKDPIGGVKQIAAVSAAAELKQWWSINQNNFEDGPAYLCGRVVSVENLSQLLLTAQQGDRDTAALRLMLMQPATVRFPTRAHIHLQQQRAADMTQQRPTPQKDRP